MHLFLYSPVNKVLDACISITWASERGLGPGIQGFFGPQMALAYRLDAISQGPKNSWIPGPSLLPLVLVDMHASKTLCTLHLLKPCDKNVMRMFCLWRISVNILFICRSVLFCGASKTINLPLQMEKIHQTFRVKNAPNIFRNKSVVLQPLTCSDHSTALHVLYTVFLSVFSGQCWWKLQVLDR